MFIKLILLEGKNMMKEVLVPFITDLINSVNCTNPKYPELAIESINLLLPQVFSFLF
jgi:hypothetical protein